VLHIKHIFQSLCVTCYVSEVTLPSLKQKLMYTVCYLKKLQNVLNTFSLNNFTYVMDTTWNGVHNLTYSWNFVYILSPPSCERMYYYQLCHYRCILITFGYYHIYIHSALFWYEWILLFNSLIYVHKLIFPSTSCGPSFILQPYVFNVGASMPVNLHIKMYH